jgi:drug/metabolite transporter (DMT)-like permease
VPELSSPTDRRGALRTLSHGAAVATMACAALMWSMAGVVTRQLESTPRFEATFWRSVFAAVAVFIALLITRRGETWRAVRGLGRPGLIVSASFATMYVCFMVSLTLTTVANTLVVSSLGPLCTALLARFAFGDRIGTRTAWAIAGALAGIVWMFVPGMSADEPRHATGMLVALGVPLGAAVNAVTLSRESARVDLVPAVMVGALLSAVAVLPAAWPMTMNARDIAWLALLGFFQLGIPCMMLVVAARSLSAPEIALLGLIEVVAGPLWAWLGAGETPSTETLTGGALVLAALVANELAGERPAELARPSRRPQGGA